jgi:ABC-type branched-subunit amino acid transport system permease subunit
MELDELKKHLKQKVDDAAEIKSTADIALLLTRKTSSILSKLKKSLLFEIVSCIVILAGFGYVAFFSKYPSMRIYFSVFSILTIAFGLLLIYLYNKVTKLSGSSMPIKTNLQAIHAILKEFTKRYFQFTMLLIPICLIFSAYLGYQDGKNGINIEEFNKLSSILNTWGKLITFMIIYLLALTVGIYYFTRWYLKKLYGKYLDELFICIKELEEQTV